MNVPSKHYSILSYKASKGGFFYLPVSNKRIASQLGHTISVKMLTFFGSQWNLRLRKCEEAIA